jgi:hypothetical protein
VGAAEALFRRASRGLQIATELDERTFRLARISRAGLATASDHEGHSRRDPMTLQKRGKNVVSIPAIELPKLTADAVRETLEQIRR